VIKNLAKLSNKLFSGIGEYVMWKGGKMLCPA